MLAEHHDWVTQYASLVTNYFLQHTCSSTWVSQAQHLRAAIVWGAQCTGCGAALKPLNPLPTCVLSSDANSMTLHGYDSQQALVLLTNSKALSATVVDNDSNNHTVQLTMHGIVTESHGCPVPIACKSA